MHCFNTVQPLVVLFEYDLDGWFRAAKCDAALPATFNGPVIEFVDLDLDVLVEHDLSCSVRDEETFARNLKLMAYPAAVVQQAYAGIALAQAPVASRHIPFDKYFVPSLVPEVARRSNTNTANSGNKSALP